MLEFIVKGGVFMYPIIVCSILSLAIFLERVWSLRRKKNLPPAFLQEITQLLRENNIPKARTLCNTYDSSISRIFTVGLTNYGKKREMIKELIEEVGRREASLLEKYIESLSTIASVSTP